MPVEPNDPYDRPEDEEHEDDDGDSILGAGLGAAGFGLTGAALGTALAGPLGGAIGSLLGGLLGGIGGHFFAEQIDPTAEDDYWREHHEEQPFASEEEDYGRYAQAYRVGYLGYGLYGEDGTSFEDAEARLKVSYEASRPPLTWEQARPAARLAWDRVVQTAPLHELESDAPTGDTKRFKHTAVQPMPPQAAAEQDPETAGAT